MFIFENDDFVVVHKAGGVLTVPSHQARADPRPILGIQLQEQLGMQIFPVHRLDYEVTGLVIFAKTRDAHQQANQWFEQQRVKKIIAPGRKPKPLPTSPTTLPTHANPSRYRSTKCWIGTAA